MIPFTRKVQGIFLVSRRRRGKVAVGPMLKPCHLSRSGKVHFADGGRCVTVVTEVRCDGWHLWREDGTLGRWAPREHGNSAGNADGKLTVCCFEMGALCNEAIERWRLARFTALAFGTCGEESVAVFVA